MGESLDQSSKAQALLELGKRRKAMRRDGYRCLGDFQNGLFECDFVSPWSKAAGNVSAAVMIVGQDWSSADILERQPPDRQMATRGYSEHFPTNIHLNDLLLRHFHLQRSECYLTNLFPFIKRGAISASIPMADLIWSAQEFTIPEIRIVSPRLVICLGLRTFRALRYASGHKGALTMEQAIAAPFPLEGAMVHCVAHTGAFGMNNRSREKVEEDWQKLADSYAAGPAAMTA